MAVDHRTPGDLPPWLRNGHALEAVGITDDAEFSQGEVRARQIYTWVPEIVSVSAHLSQAQFDSLDTWAENDLQAASLQFDTQIAKQGEHGVEWWTAQFIAPYTWRTLETGDEFIVTAQLLLLDGPYATRTAPTLRGISTVISQHPGQIDADLRLRGIATQTSEHPGRLPYARLRGIATQTSSHPGELNEAGNFLLLEGGDLLLLESGDGILLES